MFHGTYRYHIDDKGRLKLPPELKEELGEKFVVTAGERNCLWVLPNSEWEALVARLRSPRLLDYNAIGLARHFLGSADIPTVDSQGRITLTPDHREYASITHEVIIKGVDTRVELWSPENWRSYSSALSPELLQEFARQGGY